MERFLEFEIGYQVIITIAAKVLRNSPCAGYSSDGGGPGSGLREATAWGKKPGSCLLRNQDKQDRFSTNSSGLSSESSDGKAIDGKLFGHIDPTRIGKPRRNPIAGEIKFHDAIATLTEHFSPK